MCGVIEPGFASTIPRSMSSLLNAAQQQPDVVARLPVVQQLPEHLDARDHRLLVRVEADERHFLAAP